MHELALIRTLPLNDIAVEQPLTAIHKQKNTPKKPGEKYKTWVMPPLRERYIKHKKHDPL
jgi:hypothetical protein